MANHNRGINPARRRFLGASAVAGGLLINACARQESAPKAPPQAGTGQVAAPQADALTYGVLLCGGNKINPHTGREIFVFTQSNIDRILQSGGVNADNTKLIIDIGFLAHGVIKHPHRPHQVAVFEKKGRGGCEIDLKQNIITRRIQPSSGGEFYGHGAYSADSRVLYATEYDRETYAGRMVLRDAADMKVVGDFPTYGEWPHDCQFIDDGKVVAITNGGGHMDGGSEPCVTYVSVPDGRLIERVTFPNFPWLNAGHLLVGEQGDLAIAHAMREGLHDKEALGGISLRPQGTSLSTMVSPAGVTGAMKGETLSIVLHEQSSVIAATNPYGKDGGLLTFWNMARKEFVSQFEVEQPRGVALTLDGKYWVVTLGKDKPGVLLLDRESRAPGNPPVAFECSSQGSHAYIHDFWA